MTNMKILFKIILFFLNPNLRYNESIQWSEGWEYNGKKIKGKWMLVVYVYEKNTDPLKDGCVFWSYPRFKCLMQSIKVFKK